MSLDVGIGDFQNWLTVSGMVICVGMGGRKSLMAGLGVSHWGVPDEQSIKSASRCTWRVLQSSMSLEEGSTIIGLSNESSPGRKPFLQRRPWKVAPHSSRLESHHLCWEGGGWRTSPWPSSRCVPCVAPARWRSPSRFLSFFHQYGRPTENLDFSSRRRNLEMGISANYLVELSLSMAKISLENNRRIKISKNWDAAKIRLTSVNRSSQ